MYQGYEADLNWETSQSDEQTAICREPKVAMTVKQATRIMETIPASDTTARAYANCLRLQAATAVAATVEIERLAIDQLEQAWTART